jgi:hypothetical protein
MKKLKTLTGPDATAVPPEDRSDSIEHPRDDAPTDDAPLARRPNRGGDRDDAGPRWVA